jgi:hypothetical protein
MNPESNWNEQLHEWYKNSGKSPKEILNETGIPKSTFRDYVSGRTSDLNKIAPERLKTLYDLTGLVCFKKETPNIPMPEAEKVEKSYLNEKKVLNEFSEALQESQYQSDQAFYKLLGDTVKDMMSTGKEGLDKILDDFSSKLSGGEKFQAGLLKSQRYQPSPTDRADAIMELLDVLSEEVDYFRTAPEKEKKILVERLQKDPESFGYASQMLSIIYSGKKLDSWMLMAQPPSKIKKIRNGK